MHEIYFYKVIFWEFYNCLIEETIGSGETLSRIIESNSNSWFLCFTNYFISKHMFVEMHHQFAKCVYDCFILEFGNEAYIRVLL